MEHFSNWKTSQRCVEALVGGEIVLSASSCLLYEVLSLERSPRSLIERLTQKPDSYVDILDICLYFIAVPRCLHTFKRRAALKVLYGAFSHVKR